ncbi:hypothetical protein COCSADRAFT_298507 [Bipolaris sorokiniana ND90Pr]|uniref:Uncharacterized protein n=1 Tax=Cochliobolus sativus (strain ND90Pr / ATCC 201652) TaxID=665912 RepID=M2TB72_COCSN|nr:uncharacterized protein COCSADRAFT_298507 [Bipolaris sorokiniana ND90Pr]EMD66466.1 hypothetical protein COCSADRAFT_298507 [Bipolaris sorokiniana ND90Pr]
MIRRRSLCRSTLPLLGHGHGHGHGRRCWTLFAKRVAVAFASSLATVPMERPAGCVVSSAGGLLPCQPWCSLPTTTTTTAPAKQQMTVNGSVLPAPFSVSSRLAHPPHACQPRPLWGGDDTRCASADDSPSWSGSILCRCCY